MVRPVPRDADVDWLIRAMTGKPNVKVGVFDHDRLDVGTGRAVATKIHDANRDASFPFEVSCPICSETDGTEFFDQEISAFDIAVCHVIDRTWDDFVNRVTDLPKVLIRVSPQGLPQARPRMIGGTLVLQIVPTTRDTKDEDWIALLRHVADEQNRKSLGRGVVPREFRRILGVTSLELSTALLIMMQGYLMACAANQADDPSMAVPVENRTALAEAIQQAGWEWLSKNLAEDQKKSLAKRFKDVEKPQWWRVFRDPEMVKNDLDQELPQGLEPLTNLKELVDLVISAKNGEEIDPELVAKAYLELRKALQSSGGHG